MSDNTTIKTTKTIYPQIYAYVLPEYKPNEGWIKIGYTERNSVDERIRQQTHTAGISYTKLWSEPAKFIGSDEWFIDKQLHAYLRKFKKIEQRPKTEWFYYNGRPEQAHIDFDEFRRKSISQVGKELEYQLRDEQEAAVKMTLDYAATHAEGEFLWNAKPRFGKTLTTYELARRMGAKKILIVTNRPAIANSWFDDFETYIAWQTNYSFCSTTDTLKERPVLTREQFLAHNLGKPDGGHKDFIAFISLQDLKGAISFGGYIDKLRWVKDLQWDLLVIDEAHEGVDTFKTDVAFNNITRNFTLHLSGTPFKAVASGKFSQEQIYNWTYADEQDAKAAWPDNSEENNPYEGLPRLNLFSYQLSQMITDEVNKGADIDGKNIDFAFDLNEFFSTGDDGKFIREAEVVKWLDTLTRNEKYPFSTSELQGELKHTFWLLNRVASAKALEKLLRKHPVFEHYEVVLAAGDGKTDEDDPVASQKALDRVRTAIKEHDRTITLSVGQLTTGVTVPEWTAVMMLSDLKSPSLYMQAAFRAQNQWSYDVNGEKQRKENAYVFDFAPQRTLITYDEFANNLNSKTVGGAGTTDDREANVKKLLNFFPVIAEDNDGKMIELDVKQVLTFPKAIKAHEVVKRGFMSNLLFQNISGIFASTEAREILEQLNPVAQGKVTPNQTRSAIDTQDIKVDADGNAVVDTSLVVATTDARFGEKVYGDITEVASKTSDQDNSKLTSSVASAFTHSIMDTVKEIAKENSVTFAQAEQVVKQNANILAREVEMVKKQAEIREAEAMTEYKREIAAAENDSSAVAEAKARYEATQQEITETLKQELVDKVEEKAKELTRKSTEEILQKAEEKKRTSVEDDIRSRLRGFARTIPSFLMAYGEPSTTLANFDLTIKDEVFKEVTGITLDQFRALRDTYSFFDPVVFDESVQEFLHKKEELANYFDDSQTEDIFDYIPPQRTNQIYTPKKVVKLMIDKLEEENPGLFTDKDRTFADLYVKSGLYLTEIVKRLYVGLEVAIPDKEARLKHILENQVFGYAPSEIIYNIARNFVFGSFAVVNDSHLRCWDLTEMAKNGGSLEMKFDVVVGNPPYQGDAKQQIYVDFYLMGINIGDVVAMIFPTGWQQPKNANNLNKLNRKEIKEDKQIVYIDNRYKVFEGIAGAEWTNIIVWKRNYDNGLNGQQLILTNGKNPTSTSLLTSKSDVVKPEEIKELANLVIKAANFNSIQSITSSSKPYGLRTDVLKDPSKYGLPPIQNKRLKDDDYELWTGGRGGRVIKYVPSNYPFPSIGRALNNYKVFVPYAWGNWSQGSGLGGAYSDIIIAFPKVTTTETWLESGKFNDFETARKHAKYLMTKFCRALLYVNKHSQHSTTAWGAVPIQDYTEDWWHLSISEINEKLFNKYNIPINIREFVNNNIQTKDESNIVNYHNE